jgi:hypothetical protein
MVTFLPISSPFIRFAGRFVDDAFGVAAGWNFFVFEAALVPFEIVACNVIIGFWSDVVPTGAIIAIVIVLYGYVTLLPKLRPRAQNAACTSRRQFRGQSSCRVTPFIPLMTLNVHPRGRS